MVPTNYLCGPDNLLNCSEPVSLFEIMKLVMLTSHDYWRTNNYASPGARFSSIFSTHPWLRTSHPRSGKDEWLFTGT